MVFRRATAFLFVVVAVPLDMTTSPEATLPDQALLSPQVATVVVKRFQKKNLPVTSQETPEPDSGSDHFHHALSRLEAGHG